MEASLTGSVVVVDRIVAAVDTDVAAVHLTQLPHWLEESVLWNGVSEDLCRAGTVVVAAAALVPCKKCLGRIWVSGETTQSWWCFAAADNSKATLGGCLGEVAETAASVVVGAVAVEAVAEVVAADMSVVVVEVEVEVVGVGEAVAEDAEVVEMAVGWLEIVDMAVDWVVAADTVVD